MSIKSTFINVAAYFGAYQLGRVITCKIPKILMYHRFSEHPRLGYMHAEMFERQVRYLKKNFNVLSMGEVLNYYDMKRKYPVNTIVLTIDDGYKDFYEIAFPILKQENVAATFFITTKFVDGGFWLWPDRLRYILEHSNAVDLAAKYGGLKVSHNDMHDEERNNVWAMLVAYLLSISEKHKIQWINSFAEQQNVNVPDSPMNNFSAVNWAQVREMHESVIEIGAHTRTHPSLGKVAYENLASEIKGSVEDIKSQLGWAPISFCYPNGQPNDFNVAVKNHVENAGCRGAVTAFYDQYLIDDIYALRRFDGGGSWKRFIKVANGIEALAAKLLSASTANYRAS